MTSTSLAPVLSLSLALLLLVGVSGFSSPSVLPIRTTSATATTSSMRMSASMSAEFELPEDHNQHQQSQQSSSSSNNEMMMSEARRERLQLEADASSRFVQGEELHQLRQNVLEMRDQLVNARMSFATDRVAELERAILHAQQVDAEYVYQVAQERLFFSHEELTVEEHAHWSREAQMARTVLPQFQLDGLWVGKYSEEGGFELINVTYHGDVLVAHKVTSLQQANVPKGQATFQVDLRENNAALEPIELGTGAAKQWGSKWLHRFAGQGQVAAQGHRNAQWIDGHLILVGEYFSFAWLGIGHQVFFGRPSADLTLQLLKEANQFDAKHCSDRAFLTKCWEETELLQDEMEVQYDDIDIDTTLPVETHNYYAMEGCFE